MAIHEIALVEREAPLRGRRAGFGLHCGERISGAPTDGRELPPYALPDAPSLVEPDADADGAVPLALDEAHGVDLSQRLALEVGQLEVLEHDLDELLERDVGLVVVGPGLVAGFVLAGALALTLLADDLTGLGVAVALSDGGGVVTVDEAILANAADRDLDDLLPILPDDGFLRDDVGDVVADGLAHLEPVPGTVARAPVAALRLGRVIGAEDRFECGQVSPSRGCWRRT